MNEYYYYDPNTGHFVSRSNQLNPNIKLPYIERPKGWNYSDYRVDVPFTTLIFNPAPRYTR